MYYCSCSINIYVIFTSIYCNLNSILFWLTYFPFSCFNFTFLNWMTTYLLAFSFEYGIPLLGLSILLYTLFNTCIISLSIILSSYLDVYPLLNLSKSLSIFILSSILSVSSPNLFLYILFSGSSIDLFILFQFLNSS